MRGILRSLLVKKLGGENFTSHTLSQPILLHFAGVSPLITCYQTLISCLYLLRFLSTKHLSNNHLQRLSNTLKLLSSTHSILYLSKTTQSSTTCNHGSKKVQQDAVEQRSRDRHARLPPPPIHATPGRRLALERSCEGSRLRRGSAWC